MTHISRILAVVFLLGFSIRSIAQYSFIEYGVMRLNYKNKGPFQDAWWSGFTVNVAGFQFSRFSGEVAVRDTSSHPPAYWKPHGSYWNVGYVTNFISRKNKVHAPDKRPVANWYYGFLLGNWRTHEGGSFMSLAVPVGGTFNILPGVSMVGGIEAGKNFKTLFGVDYGPLDPIIQNVQSAFPRFYLNPRIGLRFSYNFLKSIGKYLTYYAQPGFRTRYFYSNGYRYYQNYWDPGGERTSTITSRELICAVPVVFFPRAIDGIGITKAGGGRITLRYGIFAADLQYMTGQVGFFIDDGTSAGSKLNQCYWDYSGASASVGLNVFSYRNPFRGASIIRFILGERFGIANISSHYVSPNASILPAAYTGSHIPFKHFYMAAELGRFTVSWDFMKNPERTYEKTRGLISAGYMIPIVKIK